MKNKMGRPPMTHGKKDFTLRVRVDDEDLSKIDSCCKSMGLTRSQIVRQAIREWLDKYAEK